MTPTAVIAEKTEVVRKRRFSLREIHDVERILNLLKLERFQGMMTIDIACGGTPTSAEVEERSKICSA
jgi:hypothetical protein